MGIESSLDMCSNTLELAQTAEAPRILRAAL